MACLVTPAVVAIITSCTKKKFPPQYHAEWLIQMLWGGTVMLLVDHLISGEIVPFFPFITALKNPAQTIVMLREIAVTGGLMTLVVFMVWIAVVVWKNRKASIKIHVEINK